MNSVFQTASERLAAAYGCPGENSPTTIMARLARSLAAVERDRPTWERRFLAALKSGFIPAGDIMAIGRGDAGRWRDASLLRPCGAIDGDKPALSRGVAERLASDERSGERFEGYTVLCCDHPDIDAFIQRRADGQWPRGRRVVGLSDAFMAAVEADHDWPLVHSVEPGEVLKFMGAFKDATGWWVYRTVRARNLLERLVLAGQAGVIAGLLFVDRLAVRCAGRVDAIVPYASCGPPA